MPNPSSPQPPPPPRSQAILRLFDPDDSSAGDDGARLTPAMTLGQFFAAYYRPVALEACGASAATIALAQDTIAWWRELTGDPPLCEIDAVKTAEFVAALRGATFVRGKVGRPRLLAPSTVVKHLRQLKSILRRIGPSLSPDKPGANLLPQAPCVPGKLRAPSPTRPKCCFSVDEARRLLAATSDVGDWRFKGRRRRAGVTPDFLASYRANPVEWWRAFLCTLFYLGVRSGTALDLRWDSIVDGATVDGGRAGQMWVQIPGSDVRKTGKAVARLLHPRAAAELQKLRSRSPAATHVFRWPHSYEHLTVLHERLQQAANVPPIKNKHRSLQAWRRTHATEISRLGADVRLKAAQWALDHSDARTTSAHYVDFEGAIRAELILALPDIAEPIRGDAQLRLFD